MSLGGFFTVGRGEGENWTYSAEAAYASADDDDAEGLGFSVFCGSHFVSLWNRIASIEK